MNTTALAKPNDVFCSFTGYAGSIFEFTGNAFATRDVALGNRPIIGSVLFLGGRTLKVLHNTVCRFLPLSQALYGSITELALDFINWGSIFYNYARRRQPLFREEMTEAETLANRNLKIGPFPSTKKKEDLFEELKDLGASKKEILDAPNQANALYLEKSQRIETFTYALQGIIEGCKLFALRKFSENAQIIQYNECQNLCSKFDIPFGGGIPLEVSLEKTNEILLSKIQSIDEVLEHYFNLLRHSEDLSRDYEDISNKEAEEAILRIFTIYQKFHDEKLVHLLDELYRKDRAYLIGILNKGVPPDFKDPIFNLMLIKFYLEIKFKEPPIIAKNKLEKAGPLYSKIIEQSHVFLNSNKLGIEMCEKFDKNQYNEEVYEEVLRIFLKNFQYVIQSLMNLKRYLTKLAIHDI